MKTITNKLGALAVKVKTGIMTRKSGEGYLDVLIKILITVIIGAALLALMRVAIPELFNDIINKIKSVFII